MDPAANAIDGEGLGMEEDDMDDAESPQLAPVQPPRQRTFPPDNVLIIICRMSRMAGNRHQQRQEFRESGERGRTSSDFN